jgi:predicted phosphodiesterase
MKNILLIGDTHIGAASVDTDRIKQLAKKYWRGKPVFLMGDLIDMGLDKGMNFANKINPQDQIDLVEEIFKPLDVRGYCIGNHSVRIFKKVGLNPYKQIFDQQPKNSLTYGGRLIYVNHGKSAADNPFLEHSKYAKWAAGDVIALGHSHVLARMTVLRDGKMTHYVRTGGFLNGEDYAVQAGFAPLLNGWAEYDTDKNFVYLKALYNGEVKEI